MRGSAGLPEKEVTIRLKILRLHRHIHPLEANFGVLFVAAPGQDGTIAGILILPPTYGATGPNVFNLQIEGYSTRVPLATAIENRSAGDVFPSVLLK